jgi:hypothetical protein
VITYIWEDECDGRDVIIQKEVIRALKVVFLKRTRGEETTTLHLIQLHSICVISATTVILYMTY